MVRGSIILIFGTALGCGIVHVFTGAFLALLILLIKIKRAQAGSEISRRFSDEDSYFKRLFLRFSGVGYF